MHPLYIPSMVPTRRSMPVLFSSYVSVQVACVSWRNPILEKMLKMWATDYTETKTNLDSVVIWEMTLKTCQFLSKNEATNCQFPGKFSSHQGLVWKLYPSCLKAWCFTTSNSVALQAYIQLVGEFWVNLDNRPWNCSFSPEFLLGVQHYTSEYQSMIHTINKQLTAKRSDTHLSQVTSKRSYTHLCMNTERELKNPHTNMWMKILTIKKHYSHLGMKCQGEEGPADTAACLHRYFPHKSFILLRPDF